MANRNYRIVPLGTRFGRWIVISAVAAQPDLPRQDFYWLCRCDCGTERQVRAYQLVAGLSTACGCFTIERIRQALTVHGNSGGSPEYHSWQGMKARCLNPKNKCWYLYGGRGITVCERWQKSFALFLADMGLKPSRQHTLDRIDNNGDYEPCNVRWATPAEQRANQRLPIKRITMQGETRTLNEWCAKFGIKRGTVVNRCRSGWDVKRALLTPARAIRRST